MQPTHPWPQVLVAARGSDDGTVQLSEETLAVGKRAINRGTTRVRRFVVETPIEEQVSLRDETVTIERRPVTESFAPPPMLTSPTRLWR